MAIDKAVDSTQLNSDLTSVANAIRTKGGTSGSLAFPAGFVSAIQNIPTGGGGTMSWFGAEDAELIYEATAEYALEDMTNWGSLTPSTSSQYLKYPATDLSPSGGNNVIYARYGRGYGTDDSLSLFEYSYWVTSEALSIMEYTVDESTLGIGHTLGFYGINIYNISASPGIKRGVIVYPSDNFTPESGIITAMGSYALGRNSTNILNTSGSNGAYCQGAGSMSPSNTTSNNSTALAYVSFYSPSYYLREHATNFPSTLWQYVDASASGVKMRGRLYRAKKFGMSAGKGLYGYQTLENKAFVNW